MWLGLDSLVVVIAVTFEFVPHAEVLSATTTTATSATAFALTVASAATTASSTASTASAAASGLEDNAIVGLFLLLGLLLLLLLVELSELLNRILQLSLSVLVKPCRLFLYFSNFVVEIVDVDGWADLNEAELLDDDKVDVELERSLGFNLGLLLLLALAATNSEDVLLLTLLFAESVLDLASLQLLLEILLSSLDLEIRLGLACDLL